MIAVRPTADGDLAGLCALYESRFGHPLRPEEWSWKYRQLPGQARSLVAVDGAGAVLAHGGAMCLPARWRGGHGGLWQLVDFAGSAGGGGLRPALLELGRQLLAGLPGEGDAPWIFGFPSQRHFRFGELVFDYRPLATFATLAGPLPEPAPEVGGAAPVEIEVSDSCGDWAEAVWERCAVLGVRRSAAFLNWRYWARPHRYYRFYRLHAGGVPGLAVFAFVGLDAWAAELWLPPPGEWYSAMLAIAADLRAAGLRTWRFWPPPPAAAGGDPPTELLRRLGASPDGELRFVGCRGAGSGGDGSSSDPAAAAGGFYFAMGDYDLV
jgi:hypothetical protein